MGTFQLDGYIKGESQRSSSARRYIGDKETIDPLSVHWAHQDVKFVILREIVRDNGDRFVPDHAGDGESGNSSRSATSAAAGSVVKEPIIGEVPGTGIALQADGNLVSSFEISRYRESGRKAAASARCDRGYLDPADAL